MVRRESIKAKSYKATNIVHSNPSHIKFGYLKDNMCMETCFWILEMRSGNCFKLFSLSSFAFGKIGRALGLNLSADATAGTEENGAICPLDWNTDCHIFSLSLAFSLHIRCASIPRRNHYLNRDSKQDYFYACSWASWASMVICNFKIASRGYFKIFWKENDLAWDGWWHE